MDEGLVVENDEDVVGKVISEIGTILQCFDNKRSRHQSIRH